MIDWREIRVLTMIVICIMAVGALGVALILGTYAIGALVAPIVGFLLGLVIFIVVVVAGVYAAAGMTSDG